MQLETYFKLTSYAVVTCGGLALFVAGGLNTFVFAFFCAAIITCYFLENTKWQISEKLGLLFIIVLIAFLYLDWQYQSQSLPRERAGVATLAHLILGLSVIKLWQRKNERDWIFLYLISFFEILLAAGLSISPTFLGVLVLYLLFAISTVIVFEIHKTSKDLKFLKTRPDKHSEKKSKTIFKLQTVALGILLLIASLAIPLFFLMPRTSGSGLGQGNGLSGFVGFSDSVELGAIGKLQQNNQVVMRIRVDDKQPGKNLRWRGVALDYFDNKAWKNTSRYTADKEILVANKDGIFQLNTARNAQNITTQTIFLEPIDRSVLFGASRVIGFEGKFPFLMRDADDGVFYNRRSSERISYKVYSEIPTPNVNLLRTDNGEYSHENAKYLQLPNKFDSRIEKLAGEIIKNAGAINRYDASDAVEEYLQTNFGYTLEQKSGNSPEPLSKFLFDVREGHCEYFATAMTIMLRTQGIAARVVNGFQTGTYNDAADMYVVAQSQAHSWVEVYFPETDSWITFDPTPAIGREIGSTGSNNFIAAQVNKYLEALEIFWLQYVIGFDNQEQRSLVRNLRNSLVETQQRLVSFWDSVQNVVINWWLEARGDKGIVSTISAIFQLFAFLLACAALFFLAKFGFKRLRGIEIWNIISFWYKDNRGETKIIEFYERMTRALSKRGFQRQPQQTPLEFASSLMMPEVIKITEAYHQVRFGEKVLSAQEIVSIEDCLRRLEQTTT